MTATTNERRPPAGRTWALAALSAALAAGCKDRGHAHAGDDHAHPPAASGAAAAPPPTNRIDLPEGVRRNLGVTFAKVERRRVSATLRVPGRFELLPSARREHRTVLPARVELLVRQYDRVRPGQVLARLDSPDWRRMQHEAVEAEGEIKVAEANAEVAAAAATENERAVALLRQRTAALAEANAPRAELTTELALAEGKAARLAAEARAAGVKLAEAHEHYASKLRTLASVVGLPAERLMEPADVGAATRSAAATQPATQPATRPATAAAAATTPTATTPAAEPLWRTIDAVEVQAAEAGVVESVSVTTGGWADAASLVLTVVDPQQLRFRAMGLQADLGRIRDNAAATIVPPGGLGNNGDGSTNTANEPLPARLAIGLEADPAARTVELVLTPERPAAWARAGVSALAEIVTDGSADVEDAIPVAAVVQDELTKVFFRRDPKDPDKVIRTEADLGTTDGRWVAVRSGVKAGDEVVLDGVYELKLAGAGRAGAGGGGHFHADGTWHADEDKAGKK